MFVHPSGAAVPAVPRWRLAGCVVLVLACFAAVDFGSVRPGCSYRCIHDERRLQLRVRSRPAPTSIEGANADGYRQLAPGYIMMANFYDLTTSPMVGQSGPLILNSQPPTRVVRARPEGRSRL